MAKAIGSERNCDKVREIIRTSKDGQLVTAASAAIAAGAVTPRDSPLDFDVHCARLSEAVWACRAARRAALARRANRPWLDELIILLEATKARQAAVAAVPLLQALQQVERAGNTSWQPRARSLADQHAGTLAFLRRHVSDDQASTAVVYRSVVAAYVATTAPRLVRDVVHYATLVMTFAMPRDQFGATDVLATPMRRTSSGASSAGKRAIGEADTGVRFSLDAPLVHATPTTSAVPYLDVYLGCTRAALLDTQVTESLPPLAPVLLAGSSFTARFELCAWTLMRVATAALRTEMENQDRLFREWDEQAVDQVTAAMASIVGGWVDETWDPVGLLLVRHTAEVTADSLRGGTDGPTWLRRHFVRTVEVAHARFAYVFDANVQSLLQLEASSLGYLVPSATHYLTRRLADFAWALHACVSASPSLRASDEAATWRKRLWTAALATLDKVPATFSNPLDGTGWMINQLAHLHAALLTPGRRFGLALDEAGADDLRRRLQSLLGLWAELALATTPFSLLSHATSRTACVTADEFATAWRSSSRTPIDALVHRALQSFADLQTAAAAVAAARTAVVHDHWTRFKRLLAASEVECPLTDDEVDNHPGWQTLQQP